MKRRRFKNPLALLLALIMVLSMVQVTALAAPTAPTAPKIITLKVNGATVKNSENSYTAAVTGVTTTTITAAYFGQSILTYNGKEYPSNTPITVETPATGTTTIELTIASKEDSSLKTVYTVNLFNDRLIALGDFRALLPDWGELTNPNAVENYMRSSVNTFVNGNAEGKMFPADENGVAGELKTYSPTDSNFRTHFLTETESINLLLSTISQPGYIRILSGTDEIVAPAKFAEYTAMQNLPIASGVTKFVIELCREATYDESGFTPENSYTVFVDKLSIPDEEIAKAKLNDMIIAGAYFMDLDEFTPDLYHETMFLGGKENDTATYTFITADSDTKVYSHTTPTDGVILNPTTAQTGDEYYTFADTITPPSIAYEMIKIQRGFSTERTFGDYTFGYLYRFLYNTNVTSDSAFEVIDYIVPASQYTNSDAYGTNPERLYANSLLSLGNFGGYVTLKFTDSIINDPKNPYGIDLYIEGNSYGTAGFSEPGNVWASNDGEKWYLLAGSDYFDDNTIRDYEVTYQKVNDLYFHYTDNIGRTDVDPGTMYKFPLKAKYPLYKWDAGEEDSMTFRGPLLVSDATDPYGSASAAFPYWGYVDVNKASSNPGSPYSERTEGFDLSWAIDTDTGLPFSLNEAKYIKISAASHIYAGAIGEKSTEVRKITRATASAEPVGKTDAPDTITVNKEAVSLTNGTYVYNDIAVPETGAFVVSVDAAGANVFINGSQGTEHTYYSFPSSKVIRVVVQESEKEPLIYYLNLKPDKNVEGLKSSTITFVAGGVGSAGKFEDDGQETKTLIYTEQSDDKSFPTPIYDGRKFLGWYDKQGQKVEQWDDTLPAELTLTAKWEYIMDPQDPETIQVTFRLIGSTLTDAVPPGSDLDPAKMVDDRYAVDLSEGAAGYHGAKYVTWIPTTTYTMKPGDTNYDLFVKALGNEFKHEGAETNYVKAITSPALFGSYELCEMTNGNRSGWMYTVGKEADYSDSTHPGTGLKERDLQDGDVVVWHYVNDYSYEVADWGDGSLGDETTWNKWFLAADVNPEYAGQTVLTPRVTAEDGIADVAVGEDEINAAIYTTKEAAGSAIAIIPDIVGDAKKVSVELPKGSLSVMAEETDIDLKVETPVGRLTIPNETVAAIVSQAAGDTVTVTLTLVDRDALNAEQQKAVGDDAVYDISISSGGVQISDLGGNKITISLPYALKDGESADGVTVWYLNDAGELEKLRCTYDPSTGLASFSVTHLSHYVVGHMATEWENPFTDVKKTDWFYDYVTFVVQKNLFNGTSPTSYEPNTPMTRAMFVTVLHRLDGEPAVTGTSNFSDVENGKWYSDAVTWAAFNNIVLGYGGGLFGPNDEITREQMITVFYRYAEKKGYDIGSAGDLGQFKDGGKTSAYAAEAMKWAVGAGLMEGKGNGVLDPLGTATRAEVAAVFQRFVETIVK